MQTISTQKWFETVKAKERVEARLEAYENLVNSLIHELHSIGMAHMAKEILNKDTAIRVKHPRS